MNNKVAQVLRLTIQAAMGNVGQVQIAIQE